MLTIVTAPGVPQPSFDWMTAGRDHLASILAQRDDETLAKEVSLPGWTGLHVLAHLAGNARALSRLAQWAATGVPTPMYAGPEERAREIEDGSRLPAPVLRRAVEGDQATLEEALSRLDAHAWDSTIRTAQGRALPAAAIPWLRCRELWIHSADLTGAGFDDLPTDFLDELLTDVLQRRRDVLGEHLKIRPLGIDGPVPPTPGNRVEGRLPDLVRWLTGRGDRGVRCSDDSPLPTLQAWL